jgi:DNA (cytosine-5)-methyltransferase 1
MSFKFVDLFAGIGGFHAALSALGGVCVMASEIDENAAHIYKSNWGMVPMGDITKLANDDLVDVPDHDVLVGGFPCQPFSQSGLQRGMDEARGTLFWNIAKIIEVKKPKIVLLENVRNISGPRHAHEWEVIIRTLRENGYRVSSKPLIVSPHQIRPDFGGRPQVRERVLIAATRLPIGETNFMTDVEIPDLQWAKSGWIPMDWNLEEHLPLENNLSKEDKSKVALTTTEIKWIDAWSQFVDAILASSKNNSLPGFPIWVDAWPVNKKIRREKDMPDWKRDFLDKNENFYLQHKKVLDKWLKENDYLSDFPPSRRKFEWQAQDAKNLWSCIMHFRPSGIRAKKSTYVPALVAITQTSIVGKNRKSKRRLTVREGARLQGFPEWFNFYGQREAASFKQLGNAVNVGVIYQAMKALALRDYELLEETPELLRSLSTAPNNPDLVLVDPGNLVHQDDSKLKKVRKQKLKLAN